MYIIKIGNKCCNVDNDADMQRLLDAGGVLLTLDEIKAAGMAGYECLVGPDNTAVSEDGSITFNKPSGTILVEVQAIKRREINAGFDSAMTASLTMPNASTPPSAFAVYQAIEAWKAEDPEEYSTLLAIHTARRTSLLAAVDAATSVEAVQAISVAYAV